MVTMNQQQSSRSCAEYIRERIEELESLYNSYRDEDVPWVKPELYWYKEILRCLEEEMQYGMTYDGYK